MGGAGGEGNLKDFAALLGGNDLSNSPIFLTWITRDLTNPQPKNANNFHVHRKKSSTMKGTVYLVLIYTL